MLPRRRPLRARSKISKGDAKALSWKSTPDHDPLPEFAALRASFDLDRYRAKETEPATKSTGAIRVATFDC